MRTPIRTAMERQADRAFATVMFTDIVSSTVRDLVMGSGIEFGDHGRHELKGIPGEWWIFRLEGVPLAAPGRPAPSLSSSFTGAIPGFSFDTGVA